MRRSILFVFLLVPLFVHGSDPDVDSEEADPWSVSEPDFSVPPRSIAIEAEEGTWMSLDVSPDGRSIAFDFLGDIYLLPIGGGVAQNVSSGFHWDMQPRFSPDGTRIAFTSDRGGADNIWVMGADGADPEQITEETFQLTNNASWSPDGQYLAARKHFTTQRSLGAGEIWLYHVAGGNGVPLVERPDPKFQKELGEPAFSPGRRAPLLFPERHAGKSVHLRPGLQQGDLSHSPGRTCDTARS